MKNVKLVCEGSERKDLVAVSVMPDSSDEKWLCNEVFPKILKDEVIIHLGALFGESNNTYLLTHEDYDRVKPLIDKRAAKKDFMMFAAETIGLAIVPILVIGIIEGIKKSV